MNAFEWAEAKNVEQAVGLLNARAAIKAGGVDLLDLMKEHIAEPSRLVSIQKIEGLHGIQEDASGLRIGPLATLAELAEHDAVVKKYTALALAAGRAATPQIRNMATVGGNLLQRPRCWYFRNEQFQCMKKGGSTCHALDGENQYHAIFGNTKCASVHPSATAVALVALGATIELTGSKEKREVLLEEFFVTPEQDVRRENSLGADEIITQIIIPAPPVGTTSVYIKQGEKESFDWPIADVAVVLERDGDVCRKASILLGAAAPVPKRAIEAEKALTGQKIDEALARSAAHAAMTGATPLAQNGYKIPVFETIIRRAILQAAGVQA